MAAQLPSLFTTAEEIDNLKRTNQFSVVKVFVEGPDDVKIFNTIAKHKDLGERVEISNRGGRTALLELQEAYLLEKSKIHRQVLFFADLDTWVFTDIPEKYLEIHFTKGYSIENDLFEDGREAILRLLYPAEKERFDALIDNVCEWYAYQVKLIIDGKAKNAKFDVEMTSPRYITPNNQTMNEIHQIEDTFRAEAFDFITQIKSNYHVYLRGKFIFEILERLALDRGRTKENQHIPNERILHGTCIATGLSNDSSNCHRIATLLQNTLNSTPPTF